MSGYLTLSFSKQKAKETLERKHQNSNNHPHGNHFNSNWHPGWHRSTWKNRKKGLFNYAEIINRKFIVVYIIMRIVYTIK